MANAIPIRVAGNGTSVLDYTLPANMMQFVQSVNAVIDNGGGGVAFPILTVLDSSNEVIADVEQGRSIPAGESDARATWARGLREQQAAASGGDYVFVQEVAPSSGGTSFVFTGIPQDARHLVIVLNALLANSRMQFNGDTAAHYHTLNSRLRDVGGVLTYVQSISAITNGIDLVALNGASELGQAIINIPYYRQGGNFSRAAQINGTMQPSNATPNDWNNTQSFGWWSVQNTLRPAITAIRIVAGSGIGGVASLYKIK